MKMKGLRGVCGAAVCGMQCKAWIDVCVCVCVCDGGVLHVYSARIPREGESERGVCVSWEGHAEKKKSCGYVCMLLRIRLSTSDDAILST